MASKTEYIKNAMSIFETIVKQQHVKTESNGATMVLTDWRQLSLLEEVDFGWKASVNLIPLPWKMFGFVDLCIFMPPCSLDSSMKGGVRVCISS
ncbi:Spermidine sinapoyl-CoA acyltransferase [Camellia lanceoleosa]|uniref:Spermidine sinapoyl-CoA acyltransferase n=1 Tax=Camellia lanceoleosa TaxID=1840588 RepID=A0ACC0HCA3_9ERIC|nr:Spermidine sinapoyl-CoA acyltransferase [Camellia lanceoleosa]